VDFRDADQDTSRGGGRPEGRGAVRPTFEFDFGHAPDGSKPSAG